MAWLIWCSVYFSMAVSVRNKILISIYWFTTWLFGRDIANLEKVVGEFFDRVPDEIVGRMIIWASGNKYEHFSSGYLLLVESLI